MEWSTFFTYLAQYAIAALASGVTVGLVVVIIGSAFGTFKEEDER